MSSISIKRLEKLLSKDLEIERINISDFLELHKDIEGYFRRLLYISLRLKGLSDDFSKKITSRCTLNSNEVLTKSFDFIGQKKTNINGEKMTSKSIEDKYDRFKTLFRYYKNYSTRYRNLYLHGIVENIGEDEIRLSYIVEKKLLLEIEKILKREYGKSAKDTPTNWGATRINKSKNAPENMVKKMKELKLGEMGDTPVTKKTLKDGLKKIFTNEEMNLLKNK